MARQSLVMDTYMYIMYFGEVLISVGAMIRDIRAIAFFDFHEISGELMRLFCVKHVIFLDLCKMSF